MHGYEMGVPKIRDRTIVSPPRSAPDGVSRSPDPERSEGEGAAKTLRCMAAGFFTPSGLSKIRIVSDVGHSL